MTTLGLVAALVLLREEPRETPKQAYAELSLTVELDKDVYPRAAPVRATVTVTNTGRAPAKRVVVNCGPDHSGGDNQIDNMITTYLAGRDDQIVLDVEAEIGDLAPRESHTMSATGVVSESAYNVGVVAVLCEVRTPSAKYTATTQDITTVTGASNVATGRFTVCETGRFDRPAAGMALTLEAGLENHSGQVPLSAVTDADGRFSFPSVPAGMYELSYAPTAGHTKLPGVSGYVELLVTGDEILWQAGRLAVTTTDPATACT
jgi:hypothetical protein